MTDDVDNVEDFAEAQLLGQRRKWLTQLGHEPSAEEAIKAWHAAGLLQGKTVRGQDVPPSVSAAAAKEALAKAASDAGGTVYGDFIIRPKKADDGSITGFTVGKASF